MPNSPDADDSPSVGPSSDRPIDPAFHRVYDQLRGLARQVRGGARVVERHQTTSLVHEAYLKLTVNKELQFNSDGHFLRIAARAMRQLLIDDARRRTADKRGGGRAALRLSEVTPAAPSDDVDVLELDEVLCRLTEFDRRKCEVVELRFFGGASLDQVAEILGISRATVAREWELARAWIYKELQ